jgi:hypothetical protein
MTTLFWAAAGVAGLALLVGLAFPRLEADRPAGGT